MGNSHISEVTHEACLAKDIYKIQMLIKQAKDTSIGNILNVRGDQNMTPLMTAATVVGNADLVVYLLSKGADVNLIDNQGWTCLHHAAAAADLDVVKILLDNGARPFERNVLGLRPIDYFLDSRSLNIYKDAIKKGTEDLGPSLLVPTYVKHGDELKVEYAWGSSSSSAYIQFYAQSNKCLWKLRPRMGHYKYLPKRQHLTNTDTDTSGAVGSTEEEEENTNAKMETSADKADSVGSVVFKTDLLKIGKFYRVLLHISSSKAIAASTPFKIVDRQDAEENENFDYEFSLGEEGEDDDDY
eukprot:g3795.t1